ncbi:MAG: hypothetical protein JJV91_02545 [Desulfosarcina sp.]|nr:hypothetical protein [Desulfobacterales bacterium]
MGIEDEKYNRQYELKSQGYDLERLEREAAGIYGIDKKALHLSGRHKIRSEARSLLFHWTATTDFFRIPKGLPKNKW